MIETDDDALCNSVEGSCTRTDLIHFLSYVALQSINGDEDFDAVLDQQMTFLDKSIL